MKKVTKKEKEYPTGERLLKAVVNQILAHPETWDQKTWHSCDTVHCVGGWGQILSGKPVNADSAMEDAANAMQLTPNESAYLFSAYRTLPEIYSFAKGYSTTGFNRAGFNRAGFNRAGFNRAGFNRAGFDRAGFNRAGFDRAGFDRAGFNRAGFNRAGFDRAGFDRDGFNRDGFNRAGFDRAGFDRDGFNRAGFNRAGIKIELIPFEL